MSEAPSLPSRSKVQFTLKRMLLATFWMATCFGAVVASRSIPAQWDFAGPEALWKLLGFLTFYLAGVSPFVAIGALIGRSRGSAVVGFVAVSVLLATVTSFALFDPRANQSSGETSQRITDCATCWILLVVGIISAAFLRSRRVE
jgi:hypothetical protein